MGDSITITFRGDETCLSLPATMPFADVSDIVAVVLGRMHTDSPEVEPEPEWVPPADETYEPDVELAGDEPRLAPSPSERRENEQAGIIVLRPSYLKSLAALSKANHVPLTLTVHRLLGVAMELEDDVEIPL